MSSVPLTQAVTSGDAGAVNALLVNGANVNERTSGGQTPLILATIFGHTHLIALLLNAGADPELRDNLGLNAIDWAQRRGATEASELFRGKKTPTAVPPPQTAVVQPEQPSAPPPEVETETAKSVSKEERSQRWLAGLKQRIAEQSQREATERANMFRARPEEPVEPEPAPAPEPEPEIKQIEHVEALTPVEQIESAPVEPVKENPLPKSVRKQCPKCGEIYNSELLAYCAHHFVALVDADDAPIISGPSRQSPALFWMIVTITLTGSLVVGSLITLFLFGSNRAAQQAATSPPTPVSVQKGTPTVGHELDGKAVSLPVAQCPLNGQEAIPGTVVVRVVINRDGQVTSARASGGDWLLRGAASEAAMKSTFSPEKLRARETEGTITYTFEP